MYSTGYNGQIMDKIIINNLSQIVFKPWNQVMLECVGGISTPLFIVQGSCQAVDIALDTEHIPFGPVVRGSESTRKLVMYNTGDIGTR